MATIVNLSCDHGMSFTRDVVWSNAGDLTGYLAFLQVRSHPLRELALDLTVANGLAIDVANKKVVITLTPAQTVLIAAGTYRYDLVTKSPSGDLMRLIEGKFIVNQTTTEIN